MVWAVLLECAGLVLLVVGGELSVRGASRLAAWAQISPLVIGLTVVAFGTSAPELAIALKSAHAGQADLALGSAVGSNIFNVLLILGISALIAPTAVSSRLLWVDVPVMIGVSAALFVAGIGGSISRLEGAIFFLALIGYGVWTIRAGRREPPEVLEEYQNEFASAKPRTRWGLMLHMGQIVAGLALLSVGADWMVDGAVTIARFFGVSELMIGLTVVAVGTSLPEVAATVVASIRGEHNIAVGNIVGSNIFNILCVLGLAAAVSPEGLKISPEALAFDIPLMIVVAAACLPIFFTGHRIARWEGAAFLAYYAAYIAYLILEATNEQMGRTLAVFVVGFAFPLTAITMAVGTVRYCRELWRRKAAG